MKLPGEKEEAEEVPVVFAGGGLVGLSTAMFLAQHGIPSLAIERLQNTNTEVAAKVAKILEGEAIEDAAIWPDDVRPNRIPARSGDLRKL